MRNTVAAGMGEAAVDTPVAEAGVVAADFPEAAVLEEAVSEAASVEAVAVAGSVEAVLVEDSVEAASADSGAAVVFAAAVDGGITMAAVGTAGRASI